jgi:hypothetical protein
MAGDLNENFFFSKFSQQRPIREKSRARGLRAAREPTPALPELPPVLGKASTLSSSVCQLANPPKNARERRVRVQEIFVFGGTLPPVVVVCGQLFVSSCLSPVLPKPVCCLISADGVDLALSVRSQLRFRLLTAPSSISTKPSRPSTSFHCPSLIPPVSVAPVALLLFSLHLRAPGCRRASVLSSDRSCDSLVRRPSVYLSLSSCFIPSFTSSLHTGSRSVSLSLVPSPSVNHRFLTGTLESFVRFVRSTFREFSSLTHCLCTRSVSQSSQSVSPTAAPTTYPPASTLSATTATTPPTSTPHRGIPGKMQRTLY